MLGWLFAYERIGDGGLQLLSALPKKWYREKFSAKGIAYSKGELSIEGTGDAISFSFTAPTDECTQVIWRERDAITDDDITAGKEYIKSVSGNTIILKSGITFAKIGIKKE
jgi:hypothetical protein